MNSGLDQGGIRTNKGAVWGLVGPQRMEGLSVADYAAAIAVRELLFDEHEIRQHGDALSGDVARLWLRLREHALRFDVPFVEGDLEKTNRVIDWDRLITSDVKTQRAWKDEYPRALVRACSVDPDDVVGRSAAGNLEKQPTLLWNAFAPLALRRPGVTTDIRALAERSRSSLPPASATVVAALPLHKLPNLSDFVRVQLEAQRDFMGTLFRAGLDPVEYARLSEVWSHRISTEGDLRAEYVKLLERHQELAGTRTTQPIPQTDAIVLPGEKLARVSDFARISRAAKRGAFEQALERAGVDRDAFAALCDRFNARMRSDATIEVQFRRMMEDPRLDA